MTIRRLIRSVLVSLLLALCFLEALAWARLGAIDLVWASFPRPAITRTGDTIFWTWRRGDGVHSRGTVVVWNAGGSRIEAGDLLDPLGLLGHRFNKLKVSAYFLMGRAHGVDETFEHPAFVPPYGSKWPPYGSGLSDAERVARRLDDEWRGYLAVLASGLGGLPTSRLPPPELAWRFESGRFVARDGGGDVRLVAGPKGTSTELPPSGENRFGRLVGISRSSDDRQSWREPHWMLDADASTLVELTLHDGTGALVVDMKVREIPLRPASTGEVPGNERPLLIAPRGRILVVDLAGTVWSDVAVDAEEGGAICELRSAPRDTLLGPERTSWELTAFSKLDTGDPLSARTRLRHQTLGQPLITQDLTWHPTGVSQHVLAALACAPAVLRPLPLSATSFLSGAPIDGESGSTWWWRDPVLAAQRRPIVLAANVLLAALCAAFAWRIGRVHCATARGARVTAVVGLLLGPLGLLLIGILVVRAPAERIGKGRRSLLLDTCPATDTPWPEPARTGREIFEGA